MGKKTEIFKSLFLVGSHIRLWLSFLGWLALLVFIAITFWINLGPEKTMMDDQRQKTGSAAAETITEEIRLKRGKINRVVMVHFANDPTDYLSTEIRRNLERTGVLNLNDLTFKEKLYLKLDLRNEGCSSREAALAYAKGEKVDGVLWGKIEKFESSKNGVILTLQWELVDLQSRETVCGGTLHKDTTKKVSSKIQKGIDQVQEELAPLKETADSFPWYIRFLIYILTVLLLPIFTISFLRTMVSKRSNKINAFVLGVYTLIGAILAFFMVGAAFASVWSVCFFIGAVLFSFIYNGYLMNFALKLES